MVQRPLQQHAKACSGFTLVELVVTISIIALLAMVAVPAFRNISGQARAAAMLKTRGDAISTIGDVAALAVVQGQNGASGTVVVGGQTVHLKYGYPTKGSLNKVYSLPDSAPDTTSWITWFYGWDLSGNDAIVITLRGDQPVRGCWFGYLEASATTAATIGPIYSIDDCVNATEGYDAPGAYGAYTAD